MEVSIWILNSMDISRFKFVSIPGTNQNTTSLTLMLLDVNDNAPELPDPKDFLPVAKEDTKKVISNI